MLAGSRCHTSGICPPLSLVLSSAIQSLDTVNLRKDDKNCNSMIFLSFTAPRVSHCSRVWFLYMAYLPKGLGVGFIFIIFIMNPFIDDLHRAVVTQNRLTFQALLPEVTQEQVLYNEKVWALLRHSRRIFFIYIFFRFWIPIKIPCNNICRKLVFMRKSTASWRPIWAPELLHCSYNKRCIRLPQPLSFTD